LWDIDLEIPRGRLVAVVGPNGAGKTTLIKAMLGLLKPVTGKVRFTDENGMEMHKAGRRIGYVPQSESVDWDFPATVLDIVIMGDTAIWAGLNARVKRKKKWLLKRLKKSAWNRLQTGKSANCLAASSSVYSWREP